METWSEETEAKKTATTNIGGYTNPFCEAVIQLRRQRKAGMMIDEMLNTCQTMQKRIYLEEQKMRTGA